MNYYLGCSGWSYDDWINIFYPNDLERREWLIFYSKHFNTVEVNSTFYRFPFTNVVKGWYNKTPEDFIITLKANRLITHMKKLKDVDSLLESFYKYADLLKEKLGCILFQLHPNIKKNVELLEGFVNKLDKTKKNVIEFRHISWFDKKVYKILEENNVGFCIISAPKLPEEEVITADFGYVRFHGKDDWYKYNYSKEELNEWAEKIKNFDVKELFVYFNNDFDGYAIENCHQLEDLLK
jgi:uncharacterized protein YecE (DUF72 family)